MGKLKDQFPVELNKIHRLEITSLDSVPALRVKVEDYKDLDDAAIDHVIRRFLNGFKGQHSQDKGNTILPVGTYLVDVVDNLDWNAGDFGDRHSCYWNTYSGTRQKMALDGTWALRVHLTPMMPEYNYANNGDYQDWRGNQDASLNKEENREAHIDRIMGGRWGNTDLDYNARNRAARAYFVPWWRMAERPGSPAVYPRGNNREAPLNTEAHKDNFGDRWQGNKASAVMHNPYGGLHMAQLAGLYTKLTGLAPNSTDAGQTTFGAALPHGQDWIFQDRDYYNKRHDYTGNNCHQCRDPLDYTAARRIRAHVTGQRLMRDGTFSDYDYYAQLWHCMDCVIELGRKSETTGRWTRTKGIKWYA